MQNLKIRGVQTSAFKLEQQTPDEEFLIYLDDVRQSLAKAFKKNDVSLSSEELTEATQRTIDRLVFIRFLEDKLIEPDDYITKLGLSKNAWGDFVFLCKKLNAKYNGIVFKEHFIDGQKFGGPELSEFTNICLEFSQTNQKGFNYNLIPIHILGSIYERFLGKVVVATAQRVKVEEKPEVRKAGGVYYTPKYIVDYIVQNTVGKLIGDKTPKEISKLRFADIACGSGSFLIGVYETLLDYHNNYYFNHIEEAKKDGCIFKTEVPYLSIKQKQNILLNNIYGVDIDPQAVEVTQLSLALKMLEDESLATANDMQNMFHEQILPNLSKNIICGNSLIGTDILDGKMFATDEERKLSPMDYEKRFPEIMKSGGFDAIVGNPPWSSKMPNLYTDYFAKIFNVSTTNINLFALFVLKSLKLINSKGIFGILIPKVFIKNTSYTDIRKKILDEYQILEIVDFGKFPQVASDCVCPFITKNFFVNENIIHLKKIINFELVSKKDVKQSLYLKNPVFAFSFEIDNERNNIIVNCRLNSINLKDFAEIKRGIELGQKANIVQCDKCNSYNESNLKYYNTSATKKCKKCKSELNINKNIICISKTQKNEKYNLKCISGRNLNRYEELNYSYILNNLKGIDYKRDIFIGDRIYLKRISTKPEANIYFSDNEAIAFNTVYSVYNISSFNIYYVTGLLNSNLISFYYENVFNLGMNLTSQITIEYLKEIPIKKIISESEKQSHDRIVSLVTQMLEAKKQLQSIKTDKDKTYYENKCTDLDLAIDQEVYKLYSLTPEEIKIVEGKK